MLYYLESCYYEVTVGGTAPICCQSPKMVLSFELFMIKINIVNRHEFYIYTSNIKQFWIYVVILNAYCNIEKNGVQKLVVESHWIYLFGKSSIYILTKFETSPMSRKLRVSSRPKQGSTQEQSSTFKMLWQNINKLFCWIYLKFCNSYTEKNQVWVLD